MSDAATPCNMQISVVIPTFGRAALVELAVRSVVDQTSPAQEIIVVIDGEKRDEDTLQRLENLHEERIVIIEARRSLGNAEARNLGIRRAKGDWIALLDDDDRWQPEKLSWQIAALKDVMDERAPIVTCRLQAIAGSREFLWPRLLPKEEEEIGDYLFCRRWPITGDRVVQTSTLLAPRALFLEIPFRTSPRFVDQDWLLRCAKEANARLCFPGTSEPLVVWDLGAGRKRVSDYKNWRWCIEGVSQRQHLLSPRARAGFLLSLASASAADAGEADAFWPLLLTSIRKGRPNLAALVSHTTNFLLSRPLRNRLAIRANRWLGS